MRILCVENFNKLHHKANSKIDAGELQERTLLEFTHRNLSRLHIQKTYNSHKNN
jgi:hypothetical protein